MSKRGSKGPTVALLILALGLAGATFAPALAGESSPEARKYALALFHFNLQSAAGGLEEFRNDLGLGEAWAHLDATEEGVEDAIIRESFAPLLDLFEAHPTWGQDVEMQGLMVDVIRERHPDVLAKMQRLDGQVHWNSFHYSDELWTAQPPEVIRRSRRATEDAFEQAGITLSPTVFSQEGQFGLGMAEVLPEDGVALLASNLFALHYPLADRRPLFEARGMDVMLAGHSWVETVDDVTFDVRWTFMDDGELLATDGMNPFLLPNFVHQAASVAAYEAELLALEEQGYEIVPVGRVVAEMRALGYSPEPLPSLIDGSWQPQDTNNLGLWMGELGAFPTTETDRGVRIAYHKAHRAVSLAERLVTSGEAIDDGGLLSAAWRELFLAGVSAATGWNPYRSEVAYALEHGEEAARLAEEVLDTVRAADPGTPGWWVSSEGELLQRRVQLGETPADDPGYPVSAGAASPSLSVEVDWFVPGRAPDVVGVAVTFDGLDGTASSARWVDIAWEQEDLRFVPAGRSVGFESVPLDLFAAVEEPVGLPLGNGVLEVGENLFVVLDPTTMLLCARVHPSLDYVRFYDETPASEHVEVGASLSERWVMYFVEGEAAALDLARRLVQEPEGPVDGQPGDGGLFSEQPQLSCGGCAQGGGPADFRGRGLLVLFVLVYLSGAPKKNTASKCRPT